MDLASSSFDLLIGGIGGLAAGTLGAYLKGYWELKGQHIATYESIQSLLAQEREKAYEQEKGKRLATHEDIENVLKEIRVVTLETETIKAQIGTDAWTRQMVWHQKRDTYNKILASLNVYKGSLIKFLGYRMGFWRQSRLETIADTVRVQSLMTLTKHMTEYSESQRTFSDALVEAEVFLGPTVLPLLDECRGHEDFGKSLGPTPDGRDAFNRSESEQMVLHEQGNKEMNLLANWAKRLVTFARRDLGVDPG